MHYIKLHCIVMSSLVLWLYRIVLSCLVLSRIILYCIALHRIVICYVVSWCAAHRIQPTLINSIITANSNHAIYAFSPVAIDERFNWVLYKGNYWSTLADVPVNNTRMLCQSDFVNLPGGFIIAPDSADAKAVIVANYWSTSCVIVSSGKGYRGRSNGWFAGLSCGAGFQVKSDTQYAVKDCNSQILILCKYFMPVKLICYP